MDLLKISVPSMAIIYMVDTLGTKEANNELVSTGSEF